MIPEQERAQRNGKALNMDRQIAIIGNVLLTCGTYYHNIIAQFAFFYYLNCSVNCLGRRFQGKMVLNMLGGWRAPVQSSHPGYAHRAYSPISASSAASSLT